MNLVSKLSVNTLQVRYFAFNALEIRLPDGKVLVVDPCIEKEGVFSGYDVNDLEGCDYVFLNHAHADHCASLGKLYDRFHPLIMANAVTAFSLAKLYDIPYVRFIPYTNGDEYDFDSFKMKIIPGRHNNLVPGGFMVRPSGRRDELCGPARSMSFGNLPELEREVGNMGTMYGNNFLMTTANNLRVGFYAGNAGMADAYERNAWKQLRPDIIFVHRAKFTTGNFSSSESAQKMADVLEITGARIMMPIHIEDAYSGKYDPADYVDAVNKACEERGILGRMMFLERGQWYEFSTGVTKL